MGKRILWIGDELLAPENATESRSLRATPSLVTLAMEPPKFDAVLLDCRHEDIFSLPHILDAAARFRRRSILFGVVALPVLAAELQKRGIAAGAVPESLFSPEAQKREKSRTNKAETQTPQGLTGIDDAFSADKALTFNVCGTQSRIGCTTQAFRLCRYLLSLNFHAAVVLTTVQQNALLPLIDGGVIRGMPVVTSADNLSAYNCLIYDCGASAVDTEADIHMLVSGVKVWELPAAVPALTRLTQLPRSVVIVSFGDGGQSAVLRRLCPSATMIDAPYQPDPFSDDIPDYGALLPELEEIKKQRLEEQ